MNQIINILNYLNTNDNFNEYIDDFINRDNNTELNTILNFYLKDDRINHINFILSSIIYNIYNYNNSYEFYFDNKIHIIKYYYSFLNILSFYISDLIYNYIESHDVSIKNNILKKLNIKEYDKDILIKYINTNLNNIQIYGIFYLLFLFNLLLINNKDLLNIYINYILFNNENTILRTLLDLDLDLEEYSNLIKCIIIDDNSDTDNILIFNVLNINILYSYINAVNNNNYNSLLLTNRENIKHVYNMLDSYLNKFKNNVNSNIQQYEYNIYYTLVNYLYNFLNI